QGIVTDTTKERLLELELKKKELCERLVDDDLHIPRPDKNLIGMYKNKVKELSQGIDSPELKTITMDTLRPLINRVVLMPVQENGCVEAELYGELANLISLEEKAIFNLNMKKISVVAGAGFEPAAFRL